MSRAGSTQATTAASRTVALGYVERRRSGDQHSCGVRSGLLHCWGARSGGAVGSGGGYGELGVPSGSSSVGVPTQVGAATG